MSTGWHIVLGWVFAIPAWMMLYAACKFRRCRGRFRYFLVTGLLYAIAWIAWGLAPALFGDAGEASNILFAVFLVCLFAASFLTTGLLRKAQKTEAADPNEAEECRRAEQDLMRWKPWW